MVTPSPKTQLRTTKGTRETRITTTCAHNGTLWNTFMKRVQGMQKI